MRLTKLKLAGFKTFVDPTSVLTPGQLVGVVGPNGCGKSNVIDAVRWVLGESKATALRGESMQDVIFNGSGQRKPVGRASVELHFDNSQGRASGQWSQYAEIAVKRVLDRDGESSYFINNLHVRRRDVIDLFMGTGLGPRAYAIIEQGMISRIIEAKPEELRLFLEDTRSWNHKAVAPLEPDELIETAKQNTGLSDFGPDDWREGFEVFLKACEEEAELHFHGRLWTRQDVLQFLETRLQIEAVYKAHPEIDDQVIEKPVFVEVRNSEVAESRDDRERSPPRRRQPPRGALLSNPAPGRPGNRSRRWVR